MKNVTVTINNKFTKTLSTNKDTFLPAMIDLCKQAEDFAVECIGNNYDLFSLDDMAEAIKAGETSFVNGCGISVAIHYSK